MIRITWRIAEWGDVSRFRLPSFISQHTIRRKEHNKPNTSRSSQDLGLRKMFTPPAPVTLGKSDPVR